VPFNDLNNAGKIQAGMDIINTLSKHHDLYLPIFIDNRESVTWVPNSQSQLINLMVDPTAEKLVMKSVQEFATV
jgi:exonuclease SbcC